MSENQSSPPESSSKYSSEQLAGQPPEQPTDKPSNTGPKNRQRWMLVGVAVAGAIILLVSFVLRKNPPVSSVPSHEGVIQRIPPTSRISWKSLSQSPVPLVWLEINSVTKVRQAVLSNQWLQQVMQEPLGRGFAGSWYGFLGTKGKDIRAQFKETVATVIFDRLLADPLQLIWFSGNKSSGTPALVIPSPGTSAKAAYSALDAAATSQILSSSCVHKKQKQDLEIKRWLLGEHALYAAKHSHKIILSRSPVAVLQAACVSLPSIVPSSQSDVSLVVQTQVDKRELQSLATLLGIGKTIRLEMVLQNNSLVAKGIRAPLTKPDRLGLASLPESMLGAIPVNIPVVLTLQLQLPKSLSLKNLKAYFKGTNSPSEQETRQIAILWTPHGDNRNSEIAILWSKPEDAKELRKIFSGPNAMVPKLVGRHLVMVSTSSLEKEIQNASIGKIPSLLNADRIIVSRLKTRASVGFFLQPGPLLSNLVREGFPGNTTESMPGEIDAAQRRLQELDSWGFFGAVKNELLVPKESDS